MEYNLRKISLIFTVIILLIGVRFSFNVGSNIGVINDDLSYAKSLGGLSHLEKHDVSRVISVIDDNVPPFVGITSIKPKIQGAGGPVNISAVVIDDVELDSVHLVIVYPNSYEENFSVRQNRTGMICYCNKTYDMIGTYHCYFWANDTSGNNKVSPLIEFFDIIAGLVVNANGPYIDLTTEPIQFLGSVTNGFPPYTWHWKFGDGNTSNIQNPIHTYINAGDYTAVLTVTDNQHTVKNDTAAVNISEKDSTPPTIEITKPKRAIYINNARGLPFLIPIIIDFIDIEASASDVQTGVSHVEFYVDKVCRMNDTIEPYSWTWSELAYGFHTIKVVAYDGQGNFAYDGITVLKFF
jgi:PKD repeat protein